MKKRTLIAVSLLLFNLVHAQSNSTHSKLQGIKFIVDFPVIQPEDLLLRHLRDTVRIYYYENSILYQLSQWHQDDVAKEFAGTEEYFIFKRDALRGLYFPGSMPNKAQSKSVDSFLRERAYFGTKIDPDMASPESSVLTSEKILVEKYASPGEHNENITDTVFLFFSKDLNGIDFSFSKKLDSLRRMKLFKFIFHFNGGFAKSYNAVIPPREIRFEIQRAAIRNEDEILGYFRHFL